MSRRSLVEIQAGRDPKTFAENVIQGRLEKKWSRNRLAQEANIDYNTLSQIERGKGCTLPIERKLAVVFRTFEGQLWQPNEKHANAFHEAASDRWYFADYDEWFQYMKHRNLVIDESAPRRDPDEIQDEEERHRVGRHGGAKAFVRMTTSTLISGRVRSSILELFGVGEGGDREGTFIYHYCLRGAVSITNAGKTFILREGDVLTIELQSPYFRAPLNPVGVKDLPPLLILVQADPSRTVPLPDEL